MINLFLLDISVAENTSGVDRYIKTLIFGLKSYSSIQVYRICLIRNEKLLFPKQKKTGKCTEIFIPFPQISSEIISERYWLQKYNEQVYRLIAHLFKPEEKNIIHIHTLNLIDLAALIRKKIPCKIITHLHCIPWKNLYNTDRHRFNILYALELLKSDNNTDENLFIVNNCEIDSYTIPDQIICVTQCAKSFLIDIMKQKGKLIDIIPNGIQDFKIASKSKKNSKEVKLLYVGLVSESKGLFFLLQALRKIQEKYNVSLTIAGKYKHIDRQRIYDEYGDLNLNLLGVVPFNKLKKLYQESDIGIIPSLQEQSSYVAIEMAMFGLPIITTTVDGLDEMFTDEVNALKVNTKFSKVFGLSLDIEMLAEKIILLIKNEKQRKQLGANARRLYHEKFTLDRMIYQTVSIYEKITETYLS